MDNIDGLSSPILTPDQQTVEFASYFRAVDILPDQYIGELRDWNGDEEIERG